jgi:hypothetical protein
MAIVGLDMEKVVKGVERKWWDVLNFDTPHDLYKFLNENETLQEWEIHSIHVLEYNRPMVVVWKIVTVLGE